MKRFIYSLLFTISFIAIAQYASAQTTSDKDSTQKVETIKIKVSGITCSGDCKDIQKAVEKLNGVTATKHVGKASATSTFVITYVPSLVTTKQIQQSVEDTPGCDDPKERPYKVKQVAN